MGRERKSHHRLERWLILLGVGGAIIFVLMLTFLKALQWESSEEYSYTTGVLRSTRPTNPLTMNRAGDSIVSEPLQLYYHKARIDRSGATIQDMLLAHAYAFRHNQTYGGACAKAPLLYQKDHMIMIEVLGLSHVLKFACPPTGSRIEKLDTMHTRFGTRLWNNEWLEHIRSQQRGIQIDNLALNRGKQVVLHIRRGDVDLCDPETTDRYLTNQHYHSLIKKFASDVTQITIFSERKSSETWDDFSSNGIAYNLQLDQAPAEAWKAMMNADTLILSKSSFSIVPSIFNRGEVIYTPFWVKPLTHWKVVDDDTVRTSQRYEIRLRDQLCGQTI